MGVTDELNVKMCGPGLACRFRRLSSSSSSSPLSLINSQLSLAEHSKPFEELCSSLRVERSSVAQEYKWIISEASSEPNETISWVISWERALVTFELKWITHCVMTKEHIDYSITIWSVSPDFYPINCGVCDSRLITWLRNKSLHTSHLFALAIQFGESIS